jgi:hypothetical protein
MKLLIRWVITAVALFVAQRLVPGIEVVAGPLKDWQALAAMAAVLGLVNALIRPFLSLITCPIQLATLGLFTLVLNVGDQRFGGQDHGRDAGRVLQAAAGDLGRVDDARLVTMSRYSLVMTL